MGDVLLHAVNICSSYWLVNKAVWANGQEGCSQAGSIGKATRLGECWDEERREESQERRHVAAQEERDPGFTGKARPCGDT